MRTMAVFAALMFVMSSGVSVEAYFKVNLKNGETINAEGYKIEGRKINLRFREGSVAFPRRMVASIVEAKGQLRPPTAVPSGAPAATPALLLARERPRIVIEPDYEPPAGQLPEEEQVAPPPGLPHMGDISEEGGQAGGQDADVQPDF